MAQRTIHYLFGEQILREIGLPDPERFLLGMLLPDAVTATLRDTTHYKVRTADRVYYDFTRFREEFSREMQEDALYLGYYLHLVEDALYRMFVYAPRFRMPKTEEEVAILHQDYHILNASIVRKHGLENRLPRSTSITEIPLFRIADFDVRQLLHDLAGDFSDPATGDTVFFTEEMLEEFLVSAVPAVIDEAKRWKSGGTLLHPQDLSWARRR